MSWKATGYVKELRTGLSVTEKFVLLILADYHRTDEKSAWPSVSTLAKDCLITDRGVQQILARLEEKHFIVRKSGCGRGNVSGYQIIGVDCHKGELETLNTGSVNTDSTFTKQLKGEQTPHSHVVNPAQPTSAIRKEPLEPTSRMRGSAATPSRYTQSDFDERDWRRIGDAKRKIEQRMKASVGSGTAFTEEEYWQAVADDSGVPLTRVMALQESMLATPQNHPQNAPI